MINFEKNAEIEKELVKKIHKLAAVIDVTSFEEALFSLAGSDILGKEFNIMKNQIHSGVYPKKALEESKKRIQNRYYSETIDILVNIYETGCDGTEILLKLAEKIIQEQLAERERKNLLLIQKYTLISAVFLMPLIIGSILSIIQSFDFSMLNQQKISSLPNLIYVILNTAMISLFLGKIDNSKLRMLLYAAAFIPIAVLLFNLSSSGFFLSMLQ